MSMKYVNYSGKISFLKKDAVTSQLLNMLGKSPKKFVVNIDKLCTDLSNLDEIRSKFVFKMIKSFRESHKSKLKIMGDTNEKPYSCLFDEKSNSTSFFIKNLPEDLIVLLNIFVKNNK